MRVTQIDSIQELAPRDWNALQGTDNPFLRYEFLAALERHGCVGDDSGWIPQYLIAEDADRLLGAVPLYLKHHSFGEFVFDWAWARAYEQAGRRYYPKLVAAVPFTPVTGPRVLVRPPPEGGDGVAAALIEGAVAQAQASGVSSLHWLFVPAAQAAALEGAGLLRRAGCQYHWHNGDYRSFDDFLAQLAAEKRKKIKRERRRTAESGLSFRALHGAEIDEVQWNAFYEFYRATFWKKGNFPPLSRGFFMEIGRCMPENVVMIMAEHEGRHVAGAWFLRNADTLYGRHWGCSDEFHSLHFETCYYQAIDYCIAHGLRRFEAGAQGEHKLSRGFVPQTTWSAHWIAERRFAAAIGDFLHRERAAVSQYIEDAGRHTPYKAAAALDCPVSAAAND